MKQLVDTRNAEAMPITICSDSPRTYPVVADVNEHYTLSSHVLGEGHFGVVRNCYHKKSGESFAVKIINKHSASHVFVKNEVGMLSNINHVYIVKMIDHYEDSDFVHIITEKYTGGDLFDKINRNITDEGCLPEGKAMEITRSLMMAVSYLHENNIVHRDIKPENILFESNCEGASIKLIDFGLSRFHSDTDVLMRAQVGTYYYMSPEVINGAYDRASDVWSVGIVVYTLLAGYPPFRGDTDREVLNSILHEELIFPEPGWSNKSVAVKELISRLLEKDPYKRIAIKEALDYLEHWWFVG